MEYVPWVLPSENLFPLCLLVSSFLILAGIKYPTLFAAKDYDAFDYLVLLLIILAFLWPFNLIYVWECWLSIFDCCECVSVKIKIVRIKYRLKAININFIS